MAQNDLYLLLAQIAEGMFSVNVAHMFSLRNHAYSNKLKILPPNNENF